jgi:hypothetical protein
LAINQLNNFCSYSEAVEKTELMVWTISTSSGVAIKSKFASSSVSSDIAKSNRGNLENEAWGHVNLYALHMFTVLSFSATFSGPMTCHFGETVLYLRMYKICFGFTIQIIGYLRTYKRVQTHDFGLEIQIFRIDGRTILVGMWRSNWIIDIKYRVLTDIQTKYRRTKTHNFAL